MTSRTPTSRAFTIVELVVALLVGVIVAGATTTALSQFSKSKSRATARQEAFARADAAASLIATDVIETARDQDPTFTRLAITDGGEFGQGARDSLLLLARSMRIQARDPSLASGGEGEVQYRIDGPSDHLSLWRRTDAPADEYLDAGGMARPAVPGVVELSIEADDGTQWVPAWDSDAQGVPYAVRITVTATSDDKAARATARRTVALDRTPSPIAPPAEDTTTGGTTGTTGGGG
jgi:type II secretory pathway pseudopilin PulG